jgi:hypothetical protein
VSTSEPVHHLSLRVEGLDGRPTPTTGVDVDRLLLAGYTGRDRAAVLAHVHELEALGVAAPDRIPSIFVVDPSLVQVTSTLRASGPETSGEVEVTLLHADDGLLVGIGSDHTDRAHEAIDVDESKGMCAKPIGSSVWRYEDVAAHWDELVLRSWTTETTGRRIYQEGTLASFLTVDALLHELYQAGFADLRDTVVFGGTLPTRSGLSYGSRFECQLTDPVLGRSITCAYDVVVPS